MKVLFIVDPQNDFVDPNGALYVKGAEEAIDNICRLLREGDYERIMVSQDCHQYYHIGHSEFWKEMPEPGTEIDITRDLSRGIYTPVLCDYENPKEVIRQVLEKNARTIRIWPHHCLEGSWGYGFPDRLVAALNKWSAKHMRPYEVYQKGMDPFCESFSLLDRYTPDFSGTTVFHICGFCKDICVYETYKAILETGALPRYIEEVSVVNECSVAYGEDGPELEKKIETLEKEFAKSISEYEKISDNYYSEEADGDMGMADEVEVGEAIEEAMPRDDAQVFRERPAEDWGALDFGMPDGGGEG